MSISTISLNNMEFHAFHGCYELEKIVGNKFNVELKMQVNLGDAAQNDDISKTVNYLEVYDAVCEQMNIPSDIIENVAWRISNALLEQFSQIISVEITIEKLAPPLGGKVKSVSTTLCKSRD
ncbi:MAG: dihydroneopterin aldolase [Rikenellaceae bacterium]